MKYLKRIFETKINVDELKDFCEGSNISAKKK